MRWRAKVYSFKISSSKQLVVSARRFRTLKSHRSTTIRQIVLTLPIRVSGLKEIAVSVRRRPKANRQKPASSAWQLHAALSAVLIAFGLGGTVYFGQQVADAHSLNLPKPYSATRPVIVSKPVATPHVLTASTPTHITIPAVSIDAAIMPVGQDTDGSIQMPPLFDWTTGWYDLSPTPGQLGPAIIVGHVDTYKGVSVFWNLRNLNPGDLINVARADGSTATFKVQSLQQFDQNNFPTQEVYGNIDYAGLRLITCGGTFDQSTASYTENTVVFASLVT